jgi:ATP-dependent DNA helicase RecG
MLAPTEILARQHFEKIGKVLENFPLPTALFVSKETKISDEGLVGNISRKILTEKLRQGNPFFVIGTHALLQKDVHFGKLGLVIVDEQHRFGIAQRAHLAKASHAAKDLPRPLVPHLLTMSATPIPRTLALALYGDLDISLLDQMPVGRKAVISKVIPPARRDEAYAFIRNQIKEGRQAFIICPRIDLPTETTINYSQYLLLDTKAVKAEHERLSSKIFPDLKLGLLHGKLKSQEKEKVMGQFSQNEIPVLVSTSVIEVGIDVPNATVMMIEGAESFGLAQLHQFRGRVGRSQHQSYCFLLTNSPAKSARERLRTFASLTDGFKLAEEDLKLRGPGQFFGTEQSGLPDIAMRALKDLPLLELSRREALSLFEKDPQLTSLPLLRERLEEFRREVHLE